MPHLLPPLSAETRIGCVTAIVLMAIFTVYAPWAYYHFEVKPKLPMPMPTPSASLAIRYYDED